MSASSQPNEGALEGSVTFKLGPRAVRGLCELTGQPNVNLANARRAISAWVKEMADRGLEARAEREAAEAVPPLAATEVE